MNEVEIQSKFFSSKNEVHRIELEEAQWVDIKSHLAVADQDFINQRLMDVDYEDQQDESIVGLSRAEIRRRRRESPAKIKATFKPSTQVLLEVAIVNWSFSMEVNPENIGALQPWVAEIIEDEVNARNPLGQNSQTTTTTPSPEKATAKSPGKQPAI